MIIRSKAPLRLGLAGGGTDVSPYSDIYGGCILNATTSLYAYCDIIPTDNGTINFYLQDKKEKYSSLKSSSSGFTYFFVYFSFIICVIILALYKFIIVIYVIVVHFGRFLLYSSLFYNY